MGGGDFCRFDDLLIGGVQSSVTDIFPHSAGEKMRILQNHGNIGTQEGTINFFNGHAVNGDGSILNIIKTG